MGLGNPAPLGLLAFGMTTALLMYVDLTLAEKDFKGMIYGVALYYGGLGQVLVAIFELIKGSSFSFAVFGSYGFFWLGWAAVFELQHNLNSKFPELAKNQVDGMTAFYAQWGVLTFCFWTITWRKNIALVAIFFVLFIAFFLLSATAASGGNIHIQKAAGAFGFMAVVGAFYTGIAELVNEEYGRHILPGLKPLFRPERMVITEESIAKQIEYDRSSNTIMLYFRGLQINTPEAVAAIKAGVENAILNSGAPDNKVHVVADYKNTVISSDQLVPYWTMASALERQYYLSVRRFAVTSFGTILTNHPVVPPAAANTTLLETTDRPVKKELVDNPPVKE